MGKEKDSDPIGEGYIVGPRPWGHKELDMTKHNPVNNREN